MNREDIIRMAREAGISKPWDQEPVEWKTLERFAALVAAAEREGCAKVCEPKTPRPCDCERCECGNSTDARMVAAWDEAASIAAAIRARGQS